MKRFGKSFLLLILAAVAAAAQRPAATPTPDSDVVRISTTLIQIDATVTDARGKVVTDLKPGDFEIFENGKPQKITSFSFVSNAKTTETAEPKAAAIPGIPPPPITLRPEQVRRTIALVVDDITLSFESVYYVRRALKKFVDEQMQPGDLVAVIRTTGGMGSLQQFTSDKRQLYAAIEKIRWNPRGTNLGAFTPIEGPVDLNSDAFETPDSGPGERSDDAIAKEYEQYRKDVFAVGTLGALNYVLRGMQELPGRKSVLMMSDGFKLTSDDATGTQEASKAFKALQELVAEANRASVVVYTMDPRGLQALTFDAQDQPNTLDPLTTGEMLDERRRDFADTQDSLVYLARQTGGFPIINSNDLSGGIRRVLDDQSYYLLAYEPDSDTFDPKTRRFNRLDIKVKRPGLRVRYRSGFFNVADDTAAKLAGKSPHDQIVSALTSPFAVNDVVLRINPLFGNDKKRGTFVRSLLHIDARGLDFVDQPDGTKKALVDIMAASFGENGIVADQLVRSYSIVVKAGELQKMLDNGVVYQFTFPVKKPGAYQFRVAIRDGTSGKVGSVGQFIEVPNLKKKRLTVSAIILENNSIEQWRNISGDKGLTSAGASATAVADPLIDTALRRFRKSTVLRYGYEVYNARLDKLNVPNLSARVRIFRDGKLIYEGRDNPLTMAAQNDPERVKASGAISLGEALKPGDYILQVAVTDRSGKERSNIATQFIQFEVTD